MARQRSPCLGATARGGGLRAETAPLPQTSAGLSPHCSEAPGQEERKELRSNARAPPRWGPGGREGEEEGACQPSPSPQTERRPQAPAVWTGGRHRLGMGWEWGWGSLNVGPFHTTCFLNVGPPSHSLQPLRQGPPAPQLTTVPPQGLAMGAMLLFLESLLSWSCPPHPLLFPCPQ